MCHPCWGGTPGGVMAGEKDCSIDRTIPIRWFWILDFGFFTPTYQNSDRAGHSDYQSYNPYTVCPCLIPPPFFPFSTVCSCLRRYSSSRLTALSSRPLHVQLKWSTIGCYKWWRMSWLRWVLWRYTTTKILIVNLISQPGMDVLEVRKNKNKYFRH